MRVGIYGGTFDPVHLVHLIIAEQCREQAALDQVWFVPAARPPHKRTRPLTPFVQRVEMLQLAIAGHPAFRVEELEKERPGLSYTADTLEELQRRHLGVELYFMMGADCLPDLPYWHEPWRIATAATLLIVARAGWTVWPAQELRQALKLPDSQPLRHQIIQIPLLEISSTDLRQRVEQGRSIRYLVPRAVECYMETHQLYRPKG
jgi:nicotinate-nucleotide adenylyltransferase